MSRFFYLAAASLIAASTVASAANEDASTQEKPKPDMRAASPIPAVDPVPIGLTRQQFEEVLATEAPLQPDQIREIRRIKDEAARAASERPRPMPKPVFTSVSMGFQPGAMPHPVRTDINTVTSLVFTDSTGASWPILWASVGDKRQFDLSETKDSTEKTDKNEEGKAASSNILTITPKTSYGVTNLSVMLQNAPAPVIMTLLTGQREVDYRLDVVIKGRSPNAKIVASNSMDAVNQEMMMVLDGVPPPTAKPLSVSGGEAEAWKIGNRIFLRTTMKVMSPAPIGMIASAGGMQAFEVPETPLILAMNGKNTVQIKISGY